MRKLMLVMATTFTLVMVSGTALAWSDRAEGRPYQPMLQAFGTPTLSVWHDRNDEFHVKSTNFRDKHIFTGVIQTDGRFYGIDEKEFENGDFVKVDRDRNTIRFRLTGRGIDEFSFKIRNGETVDFDLYKDGEKMPRNQILIGKKGWHPWHNNFYFER